MFEWHSGYCPHGNLTSEIPDQRTTSTVGGVTTTPFPRARQPPSMPHSRAGRLRYFNTSSSSGTGIRGLQLDERTGRLIQPDRFCTGSWARHPPVLRDHQYLYPRSKTIVDYQGNPLAIGALANTSTVPISYDGAHMRCLTCGLSGAATTSVLPATGGSTGSLLVGTSATAIFSTASVPPLAAGACYQITRR